MTPKIDAPDPLVPMLIHALAMVGDDPQKIAGVTRFFKEMGPILREAYRASFLSDEDYWGDSLQHHLEIVEKAKAQAQAEAEAKAPMQEEQYEM